MKLARVTEPPTSTRINPTLWVKSATENNEK